MSITGHKSIELLVIYQKVREDVKLSVGISRTYSLLNPDDAIKLKTIIENEKKKMRTVPFLK